MASKPSSARRTPTGRPRGRPPGTTNAARAARQASLLALSAASEPPPKRRRYIPGGPGGGGRFVDPGDTDTPQANGAITVSRTRPSARSAFVSPAVAPARERSTRTRSAAAATDGSEQFGFAAAVAASVKQADDYKPREERSWEEFHPNLDIDQKFVVFRSEDVDGVPLPQRETPVPPASQTPVDSVEGSMTPQSKPPNPASTGTTPTASGRQEAGTPDATNGTPSRRPRRMTRDVVSFYGVRPIDLPAPSTPKTPKVLPIKNQTAKERLDLKQPSYRKTNRIEVFESKTFGQARYVDKAMSNVGYQESDEFIRPMPQLIKPSDGDADEELDPVLAPTVDEGVQASRFGRVEYDMDEQDDMWLEQYNVQRKNNELEAITREIFEITMTKIEKEWHTLEKRIPKPNPKPPQTHRPRSGSAAAVNGEPQAADEPDSKCAICEDGDCENTNAIVFCDGCNLAVHQECYGVPFIPEGQWLCRKCQLCGRGVPTCIFCPNTDGAFKQTNSSKWAHLLCAMWIPEVSLGNHTFMEPVMDVEKVPRTRWKLSCYICHQKMGACIQCGNKNCYQAFHVTCARRARLFLKMKTPSGQLAVLDGSMILKAFCHRHGPADYTVEQGVHHATKVAKKFYKRNMKGRIWAGNHAVANVIAAQQRDAAAQHEAEESQRAVEAGDTSALVDKKKGQQQPKNVWRLPSGAPVIPQAVFDTVEASLQRFSFRKRKDYLSEACRYWTLKREARRGAALLKRLQLQMDSFSSMELTRRNFASMGPGGRDKLARRIQFAEMLVKDLENVMALSEETVRREQKKLEAAEVEQDFVDECYFPVSSLLAPAIDKALSLDKDLFTKGLLPIQQRVEERYYTKALVFAQDLGDVIRAGIAAEPDVSSSPEKRPDGSDSAAGKNVFSDIRERRKLGKRILKAVQPLLETALRFESDISNKPFEILQRELDTRIESSLDVQQASAEGAGEALGSITVGASGSSEIRVRTGITREKTETWSEEAMVTDTGSANNASTADDVPADVEMTDAPENLGEAGQTPPNSNGYGPEIMSSGHQDGQNVPPTPPQSNGSLGKDRDPLSDGGILWYLMPFQPRGTTVVEELDPSSKDDMGMLSEDLTDLDDEELKALGAEVDKNISEVPNGADEETSPSKSKAGKTAATKRRTSARRR